MKDATIQNALARLMVGGVFVAVAFMVVGLAMYLSVAGTQVQGDHVFSGEPSYLTHPVQMVERAFHAGEEGHRRSVMMLGVLLLLLNPIVRVAFAGLGFAAQRDTFYACVSLVVLTVLCVSFFW